MNVIAQLIVCLLLLLSVVYRRFHVRCPDCKGTGLCLKTRRPRLHACCGNCERVLIPAKWVPHGFEGVEVEPGSLIHILKGGWRLADGLKPAGITAFGYAFIDVRHVVVGSGWIYGSIWQRLFLGGPQKRLGGTL